MRPEWSSPLPEARRRRKWQSGNLNAGCQFGAHTDEAPGAPLQCWYPDGLLSLSRESDGCLFFLLFFGDHAPKNKYCLGITPICVFINDIQVLLAFCMLVIRLKLFHFQIKNQYRSFCALASSQRLVTCTLWVVHTWLKPRAVKRETWVPTLAPRLPPAANPRR